FTVAPGDEIGATKNGVDFSTGWTLIDFRLDERQGDWQVLIMNNKEGNIVARSFKADRDDELYKGLLAQVKLAKDLLANPTGAPGGPPAVAPGATPGGRPPIIH